MVVVLEPSWKEDSATLKDPLKVADDSDRRGSLPEYRTQVLRELDQIHSDIRELKSRLDNGLAITVRDTAIRVTRLEEQIDPLKKIIWLVAGTILTSLVFGVLGLIIKAGVTIK